VRLSVIGGRRKSDFARRFDRTLNLKRGPHGHASVLHAQRRSKDYIHKVTNHAEKYVDGNVHTNGCENCWPLLKRGLYGTYTASSRSTGFAT
jgi:hypothetical protein